MANRLDAAEDPERAPADLLKGNDDNRLPQLHVLRINARDGINKADIICDNFEKLVQTRIAFQIELSRFGIGTSCQRSLINKNSAFFFAQLHGESAVERPDDIPSFSPA